MSDLVETRSLSSRFRRPGVVAALWFAVLGGPISWMLGLSLDYALVHPTCAGGSTLPLHAVTLATLVLSASAGVVAWREWGRTGGRTLDDGATALSRSRFMAAVGLLSAAYFSLIIVTQWSAKLFLDPCMGI